MGLLHRPALAPGPHRDLVEALHRLHDAAGSPSVRAIARRAGCSHTTVFHVFCHPRLPAWDLLEVVVSSLAGDPAEFRELWLAATSDGTRHLPAPGRVIAGRRAELIVVRRHLERGGGLLVVTGEPGVGKTTLLGAATQQVSTFVARADGVQLLSDSPFALVSDALRAVWRSDDGAWLGEALDRCPEFVRRSLARILPEVGGHDRDVDDRFATARLFAATESTLAALAAIRPLALVLEDLHWCDASSRRFLERHVVGARGVPIVATIRTGDLPAADEWLTRVRRDAALVLNLSPLTERETKEQLHMLIGPRLRRGDAARIQGFSGGNPLLTEELVRSTDADPVPTGLLDLLSPRLGSLSPGARTVLLTAALATRPLPPQLVAEVTSMPPPEVGDALRELVAQHLLTDPYTSDDVMVRHPLLNAVVRSRIAPGEAALVHRRLATALAGTERPSAIEVAEHCRGAMDDQQELTWRVAAARTACARLARDEEAVQWERVLELWPADGPAPATAGIERSEVLLEVVHAMIGAGRASETGAWLDEVLSSGPARARPEHALALRRAAQALVDADPGTAVRLADEAARGLEELGDRVSVVRAMGDVSCALRASGRHAEAYQVVLRSLALSEQLGRADLHRDALVERAWLDVVGGRFDDGLRAAREARTIVVRDDPFGDVRLAVFHTDLLLMRCASGDEVADAGDAGLAAARDAGIDSWILSTLLVCNIAEARMHEGAIASASRLIRPRTTDDPHHATRFLHLSRAWIDTHRGDLEGASRRLDVLAGLTFGPGGHRQALAVVRADCDLWRGLPARALDGIEASISGETTASWSPYTGTLLCLAARAAADIVQADPSRRAVLAGRLTTWHHQWSADPFGAGAPHAAATASRGTLQAEIARLHGESSFLLWTEAAGQWGVVGRPHEAAYCHWRAAEVAHRDGRGTIAVRLLRRAHAQARQHVPLLRAIERCRDEVAVSAALVPTPPSRRSVRPTASPRG